jgi:hypothetical protein
MPVCLTLAGSSLLHWGNEQIFALRDMQKVNHVKIRHPKAKYDNQNILPTLRPTR